MVNSANPTVNEKIIQFEYAEKKLHFAGEYALLNKTLYGDLETRMISMSTDGRLLRGTHLRSGVRKHYKTSDITRWIRGDFIDADEAFATMHHPNISLVETDSSSVDRVLTDYKRSAVRISSESSQGPVKVKTTLPPMISIPRNDWL